MLDKCAICLSSFRSNEGICATKCGHVFHETCFRPLRSHNIAKCPSCREENSIIDVLRLHLDDYDNDDTAPDDVLMVGVLHNNISQQEKQIRDLEITAKKLEKKLKGATEKSIKFERKLEAAKIKHKEIQQNLKVCKKENKKYILNNSQLLKKIDDLEVYKLTLNDNIHYQNPSRRSVNTKFTDATLLKIKTEPLVTLSSSSNEYENQIIPKLKSTIRSRVKRSGGLNVAEIPPKIKRESPYQKVSPRRPIVPMTQPAPIYGRQAVKVEPEIRTRVRNVNGELRTLRSRIQPPSMYISLL